MYVNTPYYFKVPWQKSLRETGVIMKKVLIAAGCVVFIFLCIAGLSFKKMFGSFMAIETVQYDPQLKIYLGGGGNSIVLLSEDGSKALVVDTKMGAAAKKLREDIHAQEITIVNTHFHKDHVGGNFLYPNAKIISGAYTPEQWKSAAKNCRYPDETIQPNQEIVMAIGSENVHIRNMGQAHTWNDLVVYCENRKLLVTGDIVFLSMHPVLFTASGTNDASWITILDSLVNRYPIAALIPGHGKVSDQSALASMKDYFVSIGDAVQNPGTRTELKQKFKSYFSLPGMSGFDKTLSFIENERKRR
jgi:glyoxylase-like metal-dependent hydrolase (beta-lactamase superfamily II)